MFHTADLEPNILAGVTRRALCMSYSFMCISCSLILFQIRYNPPSSASTSVTSAAPALSYAPTKPTHTSPSASTAYPTSPTCPTTATSGGHLDGSNFVGMTGAQIFHEMMRHHNVTQVSIFLLLFSPLCFPLRALFCILNKVLTRMCRYLDILGEPFCLFSMPYH